MTNPLLRLLGVFLISQPFVHVPDTERENQLKPRSRLLLFKGGLVKKERRVNTPELHKFLTDFFHLHILWRNVFYFTIMNLIKTATVVINTYLSSSSCLKRLSFSFCMFLDTFITFLHWSKQKIDENVSIFFLLSTNPRKRPKPTTNDSFLGLPILPTPDILELLHYDEQGRCSLIHVDSTNTGYQMCVNIQHNSPQLKQFVLKTNRNNNNKEETSLLEKNSFCFIYDMPLSLTSAWTLAPVRC